VLYKDHSEHLLPSYGFGALTAFQDILPAHMWSLEMPTVSHVHQVRMLSEASEYHLNSDGTTLN